MELIESIKKNKFIFFFPALIIYFESIIKITSFNKMFQEGLFLTVLFSIPLGIVFYLFSTMSNERNNMRTAIIITFMLTFVFGAQFIYYKIFSTFLSVYSFIGASAAMQFWKEVIRAIGKGIIPFAFILLPFFALIFIGKKFACLFISSERNMKLKAAVIAVIVQTLTLLIVNNSSSGDMSSKFLYRDTFIIDVSVERFGLLTTEKLDFINLYKTINSFSSDVKYSEIASNDDNNAYAVEQTETEDEIKHDRIQEIKEPVYNMMNIDFDSLIESEKDPEIKEMHEYFRSVAPSNKNDYTGKFKGKNLILITAEGFSPYALNKELTPTLYKMYEEGYKFNNFYNPLWAVSTSDGEYVACTGLIPKAGIWSFYQSSQNYMPFCMGNQMKKLGYKTFAYHNHYFDYYKRNKSHPNMGYAYKGLGNGLDVTETWPESDLEMIELTAPEFINEQPFHTYYMTVSGHLQYTFEGNCMAKKNMDAVKNLSYSENAKAYLACNIEFDKAMESLVKKLDDAGIADDTVIAISPDHYPYGLEEPEISELAGHDIDMDFEINKSIFILWSKGIESVTVDEPCSSLDIIPTLSNLMGIEFDSRLLMGRDIFSHKEPLVVFSNRSWITEKAMYNSETKEAISINGFKADDEYKKHISDEVRNKFKYSALILEKDYYRRIVK